MTEVLSLNEEFNKSCEAARTSASNLPFVTEKFALLFTHKAASPAEKQQLVSGLLGVGLFWINRIADESYRGAVKGGEAILRPIFNNLTAPDALEVASDDAAKQTAEAALRLLRRAETLDQGSINIASDKDEDSFENYRACLLTLATMVREAADKFKTETNSHISVETVNPVTASKRIQLKSAGAAA